MALDRRSLLKIAGSLTGLKIAGLTQISTADAAGPEWRHAMSLFNSIKYPADFKHFDYVNPQAPRGGLARYHAIGTFDSMNPFTYKGSSAGIVLNTFDTLLASSFDEASTEYGLIAEKIRYPDDFSSVTYLLREQAQFHDGSPITPEDVIWSMQALKKSHPFYARYYKNVVKGEQTGEREVTFQFSAKGNRELPQIVGQIYVLSKKWFAGNNAKGEKRDLNATSFETILGSGPYRVSKVNKGRSVTLTRVKDYWARDLPLNVGKNNFDEIKVEYFRDETVALVAFKADQYDWRSENNSKLWATAYDFPALKKGYVKKEKITIRQPQGMQGFVLNMRRKMFSDARVRLALSYVFDFEWSNENLFYGQYTRAASYFSNSELAATGLPDERELAILNPLKDLIPAEVFTKEFKNPVNGSTRERRGNLRKAVQLLAAAGWKIGAGRKMRNSAGKPFKFEFLLVSPAFERVVLPFVKQLERLGIEGKVRTVDSSQYDKRIENFDFDVVIGAWGQSLSPGNEQRNFFGSAAADQPGSRNYAGIKNKAVDAIINKLIFAKDRATLVAATRALDRVLLWNHYVVPTWFIGYNRTVRWDRFGRPDKLPDYQVGFPDIWWFDEKRAAAIKGKT